MKNKIILFLVLLVFITSCDNEQEDFITPNAEKVEVTTSNSSQLGKKLENPYSVTNMRIAFNNLVKLNRASGNVNDLKASHYYIKFKPKNQKELDLIQEDKSLYLYEYPLDYEEVEGQEFYRDPKVPEDQPTYQYAAVKVGYSLPNVDYEIIEDLYIPEEIKETSLGSLVYVSDDLVDEALKITNNLDPTETQERRRRWRPKGTIKLWDDNFASYRAIEGVRVQARRWFRTVHGVTNTTGYYSCNGRFRRKARYKIYWKRYNFVIRVSLFNRAKKRGPRKRGSWNWNIRNGRQEFYATIFKASHHYYYKYIKGLRRPPLNSFFHTKLKIRARYTSNGSSNGSHNPGRRFLGLGAAIKIYNPNNSSRSIYATTIHELAHASHWSMDRWHYNHLHRNSMDVAPVAETWARGVERELTRMIYPTYEPSYSRGDYAGLVKDLLDGNKTTGSYYYNKFTGYHYKSYLDRVSGYNIRQIENALIGQNTWTEWKNRIKNLYSNGTENNLDATFNYWISGY